jgi:hypothetical protein
MILGQEFPILGSDAIALFPKREKRDRQFASKQQNAINKLFIQSCDFLVFLF